MCKFGANRTTSTAKKWDSRGDIFAMAKMGRVSGFWRFLGKYLGTGPKIPYWEPTGENPWISVPEDIPTLIVLFGICRQWAGETLNLLRVEPNINERERYQEARTLGKSPKKSEIARTPPNLKIKTPEFNQGRTQLKTLFEFTVPEWYCTIPTTNLPSGTDSSRILRF